MPGKFDQTLGFCLSRYLVGDENAADGMMDQNLCFLHGRTGDADGTGTSCFQANRGTLWFLK